MNSCFLGNVTVSGSFIRLGLHLEPGQGGTLVWAQEEMEQKAFQRAVSVLKGYLALAVAGGKDPVGPEDLPEEEGPDALMAVWYEHYVHATGVRGRLVAAYNAFGALPGGYPCLGENTERWLGRELAKKLITYVNLARQEEDELECGPLSLPIWTQEELEKLDRGVLQAAKEGFSA